MEDLGNPVYYSLSKNSPHLQSGPQFDVVLETKDNINVYASSQIIAYSSDFFKAAFQGVMKESQTKKMKVEFSSYDIILLLTKLSPFSNIKITDESIVILLEMASYFQIPNLRKECEDYLLCHTFDVGLLDFVNTLNMPNVKSHFLNQIDQLKQTDNIEYLPPDLLKEIVYHLIALKNTKEELITSIRQSLKSLPSDLANSADSPFTKKADSLQNLLRPILLKLGLREQDLPKIKQQKRQKL